MLKSSKPFIISYLLFFCAGLLLLLYLGRDDFQLFVNRNLTSKATDHIFGILTHLGNGFAAAIMVLILLVFYNYRRAMALGIAAITTAIVVQTLKQLIFNHLDRPLKYFNDLGIKDLHWPIGTEPYFTYSFPSGHTATAFVVFFFMIFTTKNFVLKLLFFSIAIIVGYSRIHLSQHFLTDVLAGSLIGFSMACFAAWWFFRDGDPRLNARLLSKLSFFK